MFKRLLSNAKREGGTFFGVISYSAKLADHYL